MEEEDEGIYLFILLDRITEYFTIIICNTLYINYDYSQHDAQVSRVLEGMLRQGGGGTNKIAQHMQGWSLFRLYSDSRVKARRSLMSARESNVVCIPDQGFGAVRVHPDNARRFDLYTSASRDQLAIMVGLREDVKPCEAGGSGSGGGGEAGADDDKPVRTRDAATS